MFGENLFFCLCTLLTFRFLTMRNCQFSLLSISLFKLIYP